VERNGYGRQIDSAVRQGVLSGLRNGSERPERSMQMVFIRAPIIRRVGDGVRVLGRAEGLPVLVEQGNILAATFHPELTRDETIHLYFLSKVKE
jgi:5'-phosphate synthase pdxT subunit